MKNAMRKIFIDILYDIVGSIIYAIGTLFFIAPNNIAPGGASGVAIMIHYLFNLPIGTMTFAVNIPLLLLAWRYLGKSFTLKTVRTVAINTVVVDFVVAPFLSRYDPSRFIENNQQLLGALFGGVLVGMGLAIIFLRDSTTGGTDVAGRLLQLKYPHMQIGKAMMVVDVVILLVSVIVFNSLESGLYGMITIFVTSRVIDSILYGVDKGTMALVVSDHTPIIAARIMQELGRGVTLLQGKGAYSNAEKEVLLCAVRKQQFHRLKNIVYEEDRDAFVIVTEAGEIWGLGFKEVENKS